MGIEEGGEFMGIEEGGEFMHNVELNWVDRDSR